jgi:hypothetical protein
MYQAGGSHLSIASGKWAPQASILKPGIVVVHPPICSRVAGYLEAGREDHRFLSAYSDWRVSGMTLIAEARFQRRWRPAVMPFRKGRGSNDRVYGA